MSGRWQAWQSELERIPALGEPWAGDQADRFLQNLHDLIARKRAERALAVQTAREIRDIHVLYQDTLEFFGLEESFLTWSVERCPSEELSEVRMALAAWRDIFESYAERFPPPEEICRNYVSLRHFAREARAAGTKILAVYHKLDHYLGVREGAGEQAA